MRGVSVGFYLCRTLIALAFPAFRLHAVDTPKPGTPESGEPTNPRARKAYLSAIDWLKHGRRDAAIDDFRKAAKQDGHCIECLRRAYSLAEDLGRYKDAEQIAREWLPIAPSDIERAAVHYRIALALQQQAINEKREKCFYESCDEFKSALQLEPRLTGAHYALGPLLHICVRMKLPVPSFRASWQQTLR